MTRYIGIAKESGDKWYMITLMLYNRMIKLTLYTKKYKKPKYYWYGKESFNHIFNDKDCWTMPLKWFIGLKIN